ncbi:DpnI domain-containing protein [Endomicrobium proavitum]|uniref:Type-2 restriction enzyme DpnI n=1 Tax=Endomicrobium proavitum TaxID=1408281 RepID=A0A0G3WM02_9BACT|nr:DpnI domain-containing protein [Endomicrobium proavitum]AKL98484.1 Type-2 restriction enzyme DpnI [Endomicrobium proavitum]
MNLYFPKLDISGYKNNSQKIRILSEAWFFINGFCPYCKNKLAKFENNKKLADFYCVKCKEEFELKSKNTKNLNHNKIADGEYFTKIRRLRADNNPSLFFLTYNNNHVGNLMFVPRYYFTENIIEKRNPLKSTARRAGWTGSNILLSLIPNEGKIVLVEGSKVLSEIGVKSKILATSFLKKEKIAKRSWIIDVMNCVNKIKKETFVLEDIYKFEKNLQQLHSANKNIKPKIRQQLQILRNKKIIEFVDNKGKYKKRSI